MSLKRRVLLSTFTASFAGTLLQRGAYFFTHDVLGFSQAQNLWLALLVGVTYVVGAKASHPLSERFGERRVLQGLILSLMALQVALSFSSNSAFLVAELAAVSLLQGGVWPIFESYVSAGETPAALGRMLSRYNIAWALSVAPSLFLAGTLIASGSPRLLFACAALINVLVLVLTFSYPRQPDHFEDDHPARPNPQLLARYQRLLVAARFAMLGSYMLLYVVAPLMPEIMRHVGFETAAAARAASLLDVARLSSFLVLFLYTGWHGRKLPLFVAVFALPFGFALMLFSSGLSSVLAGELLFGAAAGFLYTAALYYAQVVKNASVDAGGAHEALIGLGYALGPGAGLVGTALAHGAGPGSAGYIAGMSTAVLPLIAVTSVCALWPLLRSARASTPA